jgi:hypothetical protein
MDIYSLFGKGLRDADSIIHSLPGYVGRILVLLKLADVPAARSTTHTTSWALLEDPGGK